MTLRIDQGYHPAHLIGEWDFLGRSFKVANGILIPRPETELLVEKALEMIPPDLALDGYEIGSGTGAISVSLLLERPLLRMKACDINPRAVKMTILNSRLHGVHDRLEVYEGKDFEPVKNLAFDFIISNPPYIPSSFWAQLPEEVKKEGKDSLIGGEKGYEFYERFSRSAISHLRKGGFVILEIGHDQGRVVEDLLS
jgi:release factor glutamine methyltransferase